MLILDEDWCVPPAPSAMHESLWERHSAINLHSKNILAELTTQPPHAQWRPQLQDNKAASLNVKLKYPTGHSFQAHITPVEVLPNMSLSTHHLREVQPAHPCQVQVDLELQEEWDVGFVWLHALPHHPSTLQQLGCTAYICGIVPAWCCKLSLHACLQNLLHIYWRLDLKRTSVSTETSAARPVLMTRRSSAMQAIGGVMPQASHDNLQEERLLRVVPVVRGCTDELNRKDSLVALRSRLQPSMHGALQGARKVSDEGLRCKCNYYQ